jgi:hypothetical protein
MTTQHTPGPWIGAGPSFGDPLPRYTTTIMTEWEHQDDGYIQICELPFHHHDDENEANARLIAAAPDLLEALQQIKQRLDTCHLHVLSGHEVFDSFYMELIDSNIAKATGVLK